jgi:hypothetical protein
MSSINNILKLIEPALDKGLEVLVGKNSVNIETCMKSECILKEEEGQIKAYCRYNKIFEIRSFDDVLDVVKWCNCHRSFGNIIWFELISNHLGYEFP